MTHPDGADRLERLRQRAAGTTWFTATCWNEAGPVPARPGGELDGRPIGIKANFAVAGLAPTAASGALADAPPAPADSLAVARVREAGAVVVGTLNMDELAYGFTGRNPFHGRVPNPHDPDRLSGGSSSASAATIAAGALDIALGTDTNGSVRVPAALCGVWGLRPTAGAVPGTGVVPLAPTLDIPGPLAADAALLSALARALGLPDAPRIGPDRARVRRVVGFPAEPATPAVRDAVAIIARALGSAGEVAVPWAGAAQRGAQVLTAAEAAQGHARLLLERADRLGPLTRTRLYAGALLDPGVADCARRLRAALMATAGQLFADADILVLPTVVTTAPPAEAEVVDVGGAEPVNVALGRCTAPFSFVGLPALSVPVREPADDGLPVGVQLVARPGDDALLLALARELEAGGLARAHVLT